VPPAPHDVAKLIEAARGAAIAPSHDLLTRLEAAIAATEDPGLRAELYVALALAEQGIGSPERSATSASAAVPLFVAAGEIEQSAYAMALAAVFTGQAGDLARGFDYAVVAIVVLGDAVVEHERSVRATLALAAFFFQQSAFDVSIDLAEQAFRGAVRHDIAPIDSVAFTLGYFAVEAAHQNADQRRVRWLELAGVAATWLCDEGTFESKTLLGPGLRADVAHALGATTSPDTLACDAAYEHTAPDLVAWHRLVRAVSLRGDGRPGEAIEQLDAALPVFAQTSDDHCTARALRERSAASAEAGDLDGALHAALELAERSRRWQVEQAHRFVGHLTRRIALERDRHDSEIVNEQLKRVLERQSVTAEQRGALIASLSHDLRTPLSSVSLAADLLLRSDELTASTRAVVQRLRRETQRAGSILSDITPAHVLSSDGDDVRRSPVDLRRLAIRVVGSHFSVGRRLDVGAVPDGVCALGDAALVGRILDNLVSNAAKYSPPGSTIRVGVDLPTDDESLHLWVEDEGPGLAEPFRTSAFELMVRGPDEVAPGSGVGLFLVRTFAELQGGRAWWERADSGRSRFVVALPKP
jgi:signal transduction histidine kinase